MTAKDVRTFLDRESSEKDFIRLVEGIVKPNWICLDLGACRGDFTFLFASLLGAGGHVFAFDAFPENVRTIRERATTWGMTDMVTAENFAVTDGSCSEVLLYPGRMFSCFEWNLRGVDVDGRETNAMMSVPAIAMDTYFASRPCPNIVKIDIEGSGVGALKGMTKMLSGPARPIVLMELHSADERVAFAALRHKGYAIWDAEHDRELTTGDDCAGYNHLIAVPSGQPA